MAGPSIVGRRAVLAGAAAALAVPARAAAPALLEVLADLGRRLDAGEPAAALLPVLERIDPADLAPGLRLEWRAAHDGLRREAEIAAWPSGQAPYALRLGHQLGKAVAPEAAHQSAASEVRRLQARAAALLSPQGLSRGPVAARLRAMGRDARFSYADSDAGRDRAVAEMNGWLAALRPGLPRAFGDLPMPAAQVRRMSAADEAAGRAGYRAPPGPGRELGVYYMDLAHIASRPSWSLPSVVAHETVPGHLLQQVLQSAAAPPALRLRFAPRFGEAWAIYAEQAVLELGAYRGAPLAELGALQWRLFRMGRVLADTGLHAKGWTAAEAVDALRRIQGFDVAFVSIEEDVARMSRTPGQVAAEGLGALEFERLRPGRSGLPGFHRGVLADGPWPFGLLPLALARGPSFAADGVTRLASARGAGLRREGC